LPDFHSISLNSGYEVKIRQFNAQSVKATVDEEIWDATEIFVDEGVLYINEKKAESNDKSVWSRLEKVKIKPKMLLEISVTTIRKIQVNAKGRLSSENTLNTSVLDLEVNGDGSIQIDAKTQTTRVGIFSAGTVELTGYCTRIDAQVYSGGKLLAPKYSSRTAKATLRGKAEADLNSAETMEATIYGPGILRASGNTKELTKNIYGSGSVIRAN